MNRKEFLSKSGIGIMALTGANIIPEIKNAGKRYKAVLFDGLVIFNLEPVSALVNSLFPEKGMALMNIWKEKQFQYTWLRTSAGEYVDFLEVIRDALRFAARKSNVILNTQIENEIMGQYMKLTIWPDVKETLEILTKMGIKVGILSNFTKSMMDSALQKAGLTGLFDYIISTDESHSFKPSKAAYHLGIKRTGFSKEEILFVAFAGWDVAGAQWFGYSNFWVNRADATEENLYEGIAETSRDLSGFVNWIHSVEN